ncbi:MAG: FAD-binding oxidoreductase [Anaerolineales bacterium]|nr:FAD-binding oxidoreductase [Anaerolineales bacterium]
MNETADVIIIGGGVQGASLAFHLAEKGVKPMVLERRFLAAEATGRSSGLVRMHYDLELDSRLAWVSFQYFRDWRERVGGESGFTRTGFLQFISSRYYEQMKANVAMHQRIGIPSLIVTGDDVRRLAPMMVVDDIEIAAYEPESGYADPSATTQSFMDAARRRDAVLHQDCLVTAVVTQSGKVTGVKTSKGAFNAPVVVNAAGAWAADVGRMVGLELPVNTWEHDTMFIRRPTSLSMMHPTVIDDILSMYFRPETGGLTLVGLEDNNPLGESPEGYIERARRGFTERAIDRICRRIPGLDQGTLHSDHGGYDGITPDERAILGKAGPEGFYLQCGFSGTGFKTAPAIGACMAELIVDGAASTLDITPFDYKRFGEGKLLTGEQSYDSAWH